MQATRGAGSYPSAKMESVYSKQSSNLLFLHIYIYIIKKEGEVKRSIWLLFFFFFYVPSIITAHGMLRIGVKANTIPISN